MKAKCLMLDVDGVLVFGRPSDGQHWMVGLQDDLGISPRTLAKEFFGAAWNDIVVGEAELLPNLQQCLNHIAPDISAETLISYWFEMSSRIVQHVRSDVRMARSQGIPVFLATNQDHTRADYLMNRLGLSNDVDGIIYSALAGHKKPAEGFYSFAETTTGFQPHELVLVDDTIENIDAAKTAGWSAVHWTSDMSLLEILSDRIGR